MVASLFHPAAHANVTGPALTAYVLLDVFLIVALARVLGSLMTKIGQPRVVGEILAGVCLGPTLLGGDLSFFVAPAEARPVLSAIATLALILFMFLAGVEYDVTVVKGRVGSAGILAGLSVAVPALLGFPVAAIMHNATYAGPKGTDFLPFALLIGAALAVTAFPVMAHILMERGELNSRMGALGVATTGMMSVLMFLYISFAVSTASHAYGQFLLKVVETAVFLAASWVVVRPALARLLERTETNGTISGNGFAIVISGMVLWGLIGDRVGITALVGGFVWGTLIPQDPAIRQALSSKIKDVAMIFLLPIFFAFAGFNTDLKLIHASTVVPLVIVLVAAIGGKFLAVTPARAFGLTWTETGTLGALLNTRGLLVLVAGLIGLQAEIITITTFTIIVMVALVTNLATLPLLRFFSRRATVGEAVSQGGVEAAAGRE
jgi:Kef-type K+ transport system membrane component KefB